jgi:uncharacterized protein (UPF0276 family)
LETPELGVGLVYIPGLEPLFEAEDGAVQVMELEPQALWRQFPDQPQPYTNQAEVLERFQAWPQRKIVHGVGFPVGGSRMPDPRHLPPLREAIEAIGADWASEHLVFNEAVDKDGSVYQTGFFLPPLLTHAGVDAVVPTIRAVSAEIPVPFAIETPANYLQPIPGQMRDGEFTAAVAEQADCGILLDIHNIWTNEVNGRQSVEEFLSEIPLDRVWELHLAGGLKYGDFWLDAHSGDIPQPVLEWTRRLIPQLPNLGAIVYELLPAYLPSFGIDGVRKALDEMHEAWALRNTPNLAIPLLPDPPPKTEPCFYSTTPSEWENTLAGVIVAHHNEETPLAQQLSADPAVSLVRSLNQKFRLSAVVANLRLSVRLLMLSLSDAEFDQLILEYCATVRPERFGSAEAKNFADFITARQLDIPNLVELLNYEVTAIDVIADGCSRLVPFSVDPETLLAALARGQLPEELVSGNYEAEVVPPEEGLFIRNPLYH